MQQTEKELYRTYRSPVKEFLVTWRRALPGLRGRPGNPPALVHTAVQVIVDIFIALGYSSFFA
jgi:hypothetical protein